MIKYNAFEYIQPFRPNYEFMQSYVFAGGALTALAINMFSEMPASPFYYMASICGAFALKSLPAGYRLFKIQRNLGGRPLSFIDVDELVKKVARNNTTMWLGHGFEWETRHCQRMYEISKRDWANVEHKYQETIFEKGYRYIKKLPAPEISMGKSWIHGLEPNESEVYQPLKHVEGHTLIVGTTGAGKTRLFDILISQCILRGEAVIIIDPKGDKELAENAKRACQHYIYRDEFGQPIVENGKIKTGKDRFVFFNPAFPMESCRINPLRNYNRITEVASRISALMQSANGGNDPFKAFSWQALNTIVQGLNMIRGRPSLIKIKHFLELGTEKLVIEAILSWFEKNNLDAEKLLADNIKKLPASGNSKLKQDTVQNFLKNGSDKDKSQVLVFIFKNFVSEEHPNSDLEALISMFEHDATHFSKMVANLLPIMNMLTSGSLRDLLSPNPEDIDDKRPYTDTDKIIKQGQVAYIGLDSLTDSIVGSAIGSMILSDLTAVAGERYNYGDNLKPVNIFVDEAAETINEPMIAMLNKGRGAKMRVFVATQTIADFSARLGSKDKAMQVLGNVNNTIALRTIDPETQEYICESLPKTRIQYVMHGQSQGTDSDNPLLHSGGQSETLKEEEADLFPAAMLGSLPNLEYIAKISGGKIIKGRLPILIERKEEPNNTTINKRK